MCNNPADRRDNMQSLLSYRKLVLECERQSMLNPIYASTRYTVLPAVNASSCVIKIWSDFYNPQDRDQWQLRLQQYRKLQ
jgi:hypothetical protein